MMADRKAPPLSHETTERDREDDAVARMVEGLNELGDGRTPHAVAELITAAAAGMPRVAAAALTTSAGEQLRTVAPTSEQAAAATNMQYAIGGPADAVLKGQQPTVYMPNVAADPRWPAYSKALIEQGKYFGLIALRLHVAQGVEATDACLHVYTDDSRLLETEVLAASERLGSYAAVVLAHAIERERAANLELALQSSRDIGAAIGILMSRYRITRDDAYGLLSSTSQIDNRKVRDIAHGVLETGDLIPLTPGPTRVLPST